MGVPEHYEFDSVANSQPRMRDFSVLFCGRGRPMEGHKIGPAMHDYFLLHTVTSGQGVFHLNQQRHECREGDSFFIFPSQGFSYEAASVSPWSYMWVAFTGAEAEACLRRIGVTVEQPVLHGWNETMLESHRGMLRSLRMDPPVLADLECSARLQQLLATLGRANPDRLRSPDRRSVLERQIDYASHMIQTQYAQPISIERLASELGYHRTYFTQAFKHQVGMAPKAYLYQVRMEQAERLLRSTSFPIEEIARSVGYGDALYFSKHFRRWRGMSPSVYRTRMKTE